MTTHNAKDKGIRTICAITNASYDKHMATVALTPAAAKDLDALPKPIRLRMIGLFERLQSWPEVSGVRAFRGALAGRFRLRTGDYRLQFRVETEMVIVEKLGHRDGFYEE